MIYFKIIKKMIFSGASLTHKFKYNFSFSHYKLLTIHYRLLNTEHTTPVATAAFNDSALP